LVVRLLAKPVALDAPMRDVTAVGWMPRVARVGVRH